MDRREELEQHLTWLDQAVEDAPAAAVAALVRERRITLRELAEVSPSNGKSIRDDVAARREARRSAAQAAQASTGRGHKRSS